MNRISRAGVLLAGALFVLSSVPSHAQEYYAKLSGFQEVGGLGAGETGAINSTGQATLKLTLDKTAQTLTYSLTYSGLTSVLQSHIHLGKEHVAGGIMVFFCSNLTSPVPPAGTPSCPTDVDPVTVTGTITAAGVVGPTAQNVTAGDFAAVIAALATDTAYANIHTTAFPAGEIRGQVRRVRPNRRGPGGKRPGRDDDNRDQNH